VHALFIGLTIVGVGEPEWLLEPAPRPATGFDPPALAPERPSVASPSEKKIGLTIVHKRDFVSIIYFWHAADPSAAAVSFLHDILYRIASKLPPKECARTSILSSEWRCVMRSACPRLTFDAVTMCRCSRKDFRWRFWQFIAAVNDVVQRHHGRVVETLEVRIDFPLV